MRNMQNKPGKHKHVRLADSKRVAGMFTAIIAVKSVQLVSVRNACTVTGNARNLTLRVIYPKASIAIPGNFN